MKDKDLLKLLDLDGKTISMTLDDEYLQIMLEKKIDAYMKKIDEEREKKEMVDFLKKSYDDFNRRREFIELFKECYGEIVKFISLDPEHRIAVDCYTCVRGMDLSKQYGKPKK